MIFKEINFLENLLSNIFKYLMLSVSFNLISSVYENALFIVYLIFFLKMKAFCLLILNKFEILQIV